MIAVSSLLRRVIYPAMASAGLFSRLVPGGDVCVLTYHGVLPQGCVRGKSPTEGALVSEQQLRRQLQLLKSRYELISPEMFRSWLNQSGSLPQRAVLLTCDDGLLNVLTDMVPILVEEDARCLFFVTGASLEDAPGCLWYEELYRMLDDAPADSVMAIGGKIIRKDSATAEDLTRYWWSLVQDLSALSAEDRRPAIASLRAQWRLPESWVIYDPGDERQERRHRLLNRSELLQLVGHGMTVGAHTMSHPVLPRLAQELAEREMWECRAHLESLLQREVWALAYPFGNEGSAGAREMQMAKDAGFSCAFLNQGGALSRRASAPFALPRAHVTAKMDLPEFEAHLSGFHESLQRRFRSGGGAAGQAAPRRKE